MSREALVKHWLRLSTGQFRGYEVVLFCYDILSRQRMMRQACVQAKLSFDGMVCCVPSMCPCFVVVFSALWLFHCAHSVESVSVDL
jgi:hypothetical protein